MKFIVMIALCIAAACATVTRGVEEVYVVESSPPGAHVTLFYDEPVILYVEDSQGPAAPGDIGANDAQQETITLEEMHGITPATFRIPRRGEFTVTIEKPGYAPVTTHVKTQVAAHGGAALAGNVCLGGCLGAAVDAGSGATLEHVPDKISVTLEKMNER